MIPKINSNTKKLFESYFKPSFKSVLFIVFIIIVSSLLAIVDPIIVKYIIDDVILEKKMSLLIGIIFISISIKLFNHAIVLYSDYLISLTTGELSKKIVVDLYKHVQSLDMSFFNNNKLGNITQRIADDTFIVAEDLFYVLIQAISAIFSIIVSLIFIFYFNTKLALASLIILPMFVIFIKIVAKKYKESVFKDRVLFDEFTSFIQEKLSSIQLVKELGIEDKIIENIDKIRDAIKYNTIKIYMLSNLTKNGVGFFNYLGPMLVLFYGAYLYNNDEITLGVLSGFFYFIAQLYHPISILVENKLNFSRAITSIDRIYEYMNLSPKITDPVRSIDLDTIKGSISFQNVDFWYENKEPVLNNLSFDIADNEYVAVVGSSGAGKSTIANLIFRLYEPLSGNIEIGGNNIDRYKVKKLRNQIALVSQNIILFHSSISENLKIMNSNITDDEMIEACKLANIHKFINSLPLKYDTVVGERGVKLSGGQKQRISIARAILKKAKILIFDEATSHLDSESEKSIQESLDKIRNKITVIVIAHRLSTIVNCDKIFVLDKGCIKETGTHKELLKQEGIYKKLWGTQLKQP